MPVTQNDLDWLEIRLSISVYETNQELLGQTMSAIDRIKAKALQARGIAPQIIKDFESDLDSIIAEGPKLKAAKDAAVGQHKEAFAGVYDEIDGLKSAIDLLSNGGPPLDGSPDSSDASAPPPEDDGIARSRRGNPV